MQLAEFLKAYIKLLNSKGVSHCVLRNYEGLPEENPGNDIDFLIRNNDVAIAIATLFEIQQIDITGILRRPYVATLFVRGVKWGEGRHAIEIDLVSLLSWKGIPYLSTEVVLNQATSIDDGVGLLKKPSPHHEAIISFFSSYLVGGWIKERYQERIIDIFNKEKKEIREALSFLPKDFALSLIDAVIVDNRMQLMTCLPTIKKYLLINSFVAKPVSSLRNVILHFFTEIKIRFTPFPVNTICFLGPDGSGKSSVIYALCKKLNGATKEIAYRHLKPGTCLSNQTTNVVTNPHASPSRSKITSVGKITYWLLLYWFDRYFHGHKNLTLRIWDRYYYDLLVDPKRYRYGGPMWIARLIGKFVPKPDMIILLDALPEVLQARKHEVTFAESARQQQAYLQLVRGMKNAMMIDASQPMEKVIEETSEKILDFMSQRTAKRFNLD